MKRIAIKLVVFLLLGAVTTVAVAWSSLWWAPLPDPGNSAVQSSSAAASEGPDYVYLRTHRYQRLGAGWVSSSWVDPSARAGLAASFQCTRIKPHDIVPSWAGLALPGDHDADWGFHSRFVEARGWPLLSHAWAYAHCSRWNRDLRQRETQVDCKYGILISVATERAQYVHPDVWTLRMLPLRPIFPGFLINTLFYALVLWLLWSAPFVTRRLIRRRRGNCIRCGYDLRHAEHAACPECGRRPDPE